MCTYKVQKAHMHKAHDVNQMKKLIRSENRNKYWNKFI